MWGCPIQPPQPLALGVDINYLGLNDVGEVNAELLHDQKHCPVVYACLCTPELRSVALGRRCCWAAPRRRGQS